MTSAQSVQQQSTTGNSRVKAYAKGVPLPKGGLTLGILALGNLLISMFPGVAAAPIRVVFGVVALAFFIPIAAKFIMHPAVILREDANNPVVAPVSATIAMTVMQFATYLASIGGVWMTIALVVWAIAVVANAVLMVWVAYRFVFREFKLANVYPTWFVGFVGIVVASATSAQVGARPVGRVIFWIGFVLYMAMLVLVTVRVFRIELPDAVKPSLAIYTAPMSLSISGYTTAFDEPNVWFVLVMLILAQILLVIVLTRMPKLLRLPFVPSYAAFTFPFVITATALFKALNLFAANGWAFPTWLYGLQIVETVLACVIVAYVACRFAIAMRGRWSRL